MLPKSFPEVNTKFIAPEGLTEAQVQPIDAYHGEVKGGSVDGVEVVVTCWEPTPEELKNLNEGKSIFLTFLGGLPPHYVSTSFQEAISIQ